MISYEPLWDTMKRKEISTYTLINKYGVSARTIYNLKHNQGITLFTLDKLCLILDCQPNDIIRFTKE